MKPFFADRRKQSQRTRRSALKRCRPIVEVLEDRRLLSLTPYLVADINTTAGTGSSAMTFSELGGIAYFTADDGVNGYELWRSDGTAEGTYLLKDINPSGNSLPQRHVVLDGTLYFGPV